MIYIDGACIGNPGQAAASACFFAVQNSNLNQADGDTDSDDDAGNLSDPGELTSSDEDEILQEKHG